MIWVLQNESDDNTVYNIEVSYLLTLFVVVQFCGLGLVFFATYVMYICATKSYIYKNKKSLKDSNVGNVSKKSHNRSMSVMIMALFVNYKYYCLCLFDLGGMIGKVKPKRFRNDQLYVKYCWHISLEFVLILTQILFVVEMSESLVLKIFYCIHQGLLLVLMGLVGKIVYTMLQLKKLKKREAKGGEGSGKEGEN